MGTHLRMACSEGQVHPYPGLNWSFSPALLCSRQASYKSPKTESSRETEPMGSETRWSCAKACVNL